MQHNRYNGTSRKQHTTTFYGTTYFIGNITENNYWWYLNTGSRRLCQLHMTITWQGIKESRILISAYQENTTGRQCSKTFDNTSGHAISVRREEKNAKQNQCSQQKYL